MRRIFNFIPALFLLCFSSMNAQVSILIIADEGCDSLEITAFLEPGEAYDTITALTWSIIETGQSINGDTLRMKFHEPGDYSLTVNIIGNAEFSLNENITVYESPQSGFYYTAATSGNPFAYSFVADSIANSSAISYEWYVNNELEGNSAEFVYIFEQEGKYIVQLTAINENGCESISSQEIIVSESLLCPNVFTPNMDGYNDFFQVKTDGNTIYTFQVYSRTGIKVFHSESPSISWDGRSMSGIEMQPGLYFYLIEHNNGSQAEKISGFVHLIR